MVILGKLPLIAGAVARVFSMPWLKSTGEADVQGTINARAAIVAEERIEDIVND